jgi:hypothetical protein
MAEIKNIDSSVMDANTGEYRTNNDITQHGSLYNYCYEIIRSGYKGPAFLEMMKNYFPNYNISLL